MMKRGIRSSPHRTAAIRIVFALFMGLMPLTARAHQAVSQSTAIDVTAEITAIDYDERVVVLEDEGGNVEWVYAEPEIKRFNELKVGDKVTFRYYESVLSQITRASDQAPAPAATEPKMVSGTGPKPSGIISQQFSARVTIKAIDPKSKSMTVALDDGRAMSLEVIDKKILKAVKVGDKVDVTYTAAFMIAVQ
jgi:Cu/Ag efflux protein CusF